MNYLTLKYRYTSTSQSLFSDLETSQGTCTNHKVSVRTHSSSYEVCRVFLSISTGVSALVPQDPTGPLMWSWLTKVSAACSPARGGARGLVLPRVQRKPCIGATWDYICRLSSDPALH